MSPEQMFIVEMAWILVWLVSILAVGGTVVGLAAFYKTGRGGAKTFGYIFSRGNLLKLLIAMAIVLIAAVLNIIGKIGAEAVVSILSGIASYVLGSASASRPKTDADEGEPER
jgi:hypothetical protein